MMGLCGSMRLPGALPRPRQHPVRIKLKCKGSPSSSITTTPPITTSLFSPPRAYRPCVKSKPSSRNMNFTACSAKWEPATIVSISSSARCASFMRKLTATLRPTAARKSLLTMPTLGLPGFLRISMDMVASFCQMLRETRSSRIKHGRMYSWACRWRGSRTRMMIKTHRARSSNCFTPGWTARRLSVISRASSRDTLVSIPAWANLMTSILKESKGGCSITSRFAGCPPRPLAQYLMLEVFGAVTSGRTPKFTQTRA
mmetsp:Transcript_32773/g.52749  ORF Transcript_32773/g.52749 Transcript_32773/m.52749 type:complete len:257 (+) Transcript_32773:866-1636(+)